MPGMEGTSDARFRTHHDSDSRKSQKTDSGSDSSKKYTDSIPNPVQIPTKNWVIAKSESRITGLHPTPHL